MKKIIDRAVVICMFMYAPVGVLGYLSYVENVPKLVVFRYTLDGSSNLFDIPMIIARALIALNLILCIPLNLNPTRLAIK